MILKWIGQWNIGLSYLFETFECKYCMEDLSWLIIQYIHCERRHVSSCFNKCLLLLSYYLRKNAWRLSAFLDTLSSRQQIGKDVNGFFVCDAHFFLQYAIPILAIVQNWSEASQYPKFKCLYIEYWIMSSKWVFLIIIYAVSARKSKKRCNTQSVKV